ncbi:MAG: GNAT family N-acetyltransferase [Chloroflexota bacterium]|nr:GNAT family N-acetyltransferase [Chloroflexota bacterium]
MSTKINALQLPKGFRIRPAMMGDVPAVVKLSNIFTQHYLGISEDDIDDTENAWEEPGFSPSDDVRLVFSSQDELVGYIEVWSNASPPVHPWLWGYVNPDYEGCGLGTYLLTWGETRAREAVSRCPENARVAIQCGIESTIDTVKERFSEYGMQIIRHYFRMRIEMDAPPPAPQWPEGITLRPYNPEKDAESVYRIDDEVFQDHFGYVQEPFEEGFERFMHHMAKKESYDPTLWFLAVDDDEIAAICLCRKWDTEDRDCGYVSILGVRRPWRQRGLGLTLLQHFFGEFYRRGKRKVALGVDGQNLTGALRLYKKAGMSVHRQFDLYEKELRAGEEISVVAI